MSESLDSKEEKSGLRRFCIKPDCQKEIPADAKCCPSCNVRIRIQPRLEDEVCCINPDCRETLFTSSAERCHKCLALQKPGSGTSMVEIENVGRESTQPQIQSNTKMDGLKAVADTTPPLSSSGHMSLSEECAETETQPGDGSSYDGGEQKAVQPGITIAPASQLPPQPGGPTADKGENPTPIISTKDPERVQEITTPIKALKDSTTPDPNPDIITIPVQETTPSSAAGNVRHELTPYKKPDFKDQPELLPNRRRDKDKDEGKTNKSDKYGGLHRSKSEISIEGFRAPADQSFGITFHVLVPTGVWGWDSQSHICMQFGHELLGKWEKDIGDFTIVKRNAGDGLYEMYCTLSIDSSILRNSTIQGIPYKYLIYSKRGDIKQPYEFIDASGGGDIVNRCLLICTEDLQLRGHYHQYDSLVYPEIKTSKSMVTQLFETVKGLFIEKQGLDHESRQEKGLHVYMEEHKEVLSSCKFPADYSITKTAKEIVDIFVKLYLPHIHHHHSEHLWVARHLPQAMLKWLLSILDAIKAKSCDSSEVNGRRIAAAITVLSCFHKFVPKYLKAEDIPLDCIKEMMLLLRLTPDIKNKKCLDYDLVVELVPHSSRKETAEAIRHFCTQLLHNRDLRNPEWLYAIPLIHFLRGDSSPFQRPELNPEKMQWGDKTLGLNEVIRKTFDKDFGLVDSHLKQMRPLIAADPLFLQVLVYVCPKKELPLLILQIPPYVSIAWIAKADRKSLNKNEIKEVQQLVESITDIVKSTPTENVTDVKHLESTVNAALLLLSRLIGKLLKSSTHALKAIVSLTLHTAKQLWDYTSFAGIQDQQVTSLISRRNEILYQCLNEWVKKFYSSSFGDATLKEANNEINLWLDLLQLHCPEELVGTWCSIVERIVKERIIEVTLFQRIDLLCKLESNSKKHLILTKTFMEVAIEGLRQMLSDSEGTKEAVRRSVEKLMTVENKTCVSKLFDICLKEWYSHGTECIALDDLLNWDLWPSFLKIYASEIHAKEEDSIISHLPWNCQKICANAYGRVVKVCEQVLNGSIAMNELQKVRDRLGHMKELCIAVSVGGKQMYYEFKQIKAALDQRIAEYEAFHHRKQLLLVLCSKITVPIQGMNELMQQLEADHSCTEIKTMCSSDSQNVFTFHCFMSASSLDPILVKFNAMMQIHPNDLFNVIWHITMTRAVSTKPVLQMDDIVTQMWDPAFHLSQELLDQLHDHTMKLSRVENDFRHYRYQPDHLQGNLMSLCKGVNLCLERMDASFSWVHGVVLTIQEYWSLCQYQTAACTLLKLQKELKLTGDFQVVVKLAEQVSVSMKDQPLSAVNQKLIDAGAFLKDLASEHSKLDCLETFSKCLGVVRWIRSETKDVSDLQKFVNVSLTTAVEGEGDIANDMLSNLRTVGSGYGPLIYDLKENTDFETLATCCKSVWNFLKHTSSLPHLLSECSKDIEWFKDLKTRQGSVEESSIGQMENIIEYGCYKIGSGIYQLCQSSSHIVKLSLEEGGRRLSKRIYTLDDLKDLESKLVLITGSRAENRKQVDQFLNTLQSVRRIADVLIDLRQAGNVKYTHWVLTFYCKQDLVTDLQRLASRMEEELHVWKKKVDLHRCEFYELNYYTTPQLLSLREELGHLKDAGSNASINPETLTLLQSISLDVTAPDIQEVVVNVTAVLIEQQNDTHTSPSEAVSENMTGTSLEQHHPQLTRQGMQATVQPRAIPEGLTEKQMEIFTNLVTVYEYPKTLVKIALENCGGDYDAVESWVMENADEEEPAGIYPDDTLLSHSMQVEELADVCSEVKPQAPPKTLSSVEPKISFTKKPLVDRSHHLVHQLVEAGYATEKAVDAVERCDELEEAMDYLESFERKGEVFQSSDTFLPLPIEFKQLQRCDDVLNISTSDKAEESYLSLMELGIVLQELSSVLPAAVPQQRPFSSKCLKVGAPNLLVTSPDKVLMTVLGLYIKGKEFPLPTPEEVLICNKNTTAEEVTLLWRRAIGDTDVRRIFCLVHSEELSYHVCDSILKSLSELTQGRAEYKLVIICGSEGSHIVSKLQIYRRHNVVLPDIQQCKKYLKRHFTIKATTHGNQMTASSVDHESSCVRVVSSTRAGMGKSLYIKRMAELLQKQTGVRAVTVTIPIHGPVVTPDTVIEFLKNHMNTFNCIFHFDIAPGVLRNVDTILFCLLILRGLTDIKGRVWRCHYSHLYTIEVTVTEVQRDNHSTPASCTLGLLKLLPSVECISPRQALQLMKARRKVGLVLSSDIHSLGRMHQPAAVENIIVMDEQEYKSPPCQMVSQYLGHHNDQKNLDRFSYTGKVFDSPDECLEIILKFCGIKDPSWSEIHHFVRFLHIQLQFCEGSAFCAEQNVHDVMAGLKGFVVKFMIHMSRDFATSSLHGEVARGNIEAMNERQDLQEYQIDNRRQWEQRPHPYIFFNNDQNCITFVGFMVTKQGDLIDPEHHKKVLEAAIMRPELYAGLKRNGVNFEEDYRYWKKQTLIDKLAMVMGITGEPIDPDVSYVLTVDNLIKILAIQMRFRCGIPVVIMGETGCGKTRLVQYMCDLERQGIVRRNMMILKVHGGITEDDIEQFVKKAHEEAVENRKHCLNTVVFFDEANTTEAIGLIKEIMCDRRLHGKRIAKDLKIIATCNPYRKHTDEMIKKLESAGLGFYVKATETQQKLGKVPLRQLVYRVLDLPPSMRPLVYDFGQLNMKTETEYIREIVSNHVPLEARLSSHAFIDSVSRVLMFSQSYMKNREDECSFVSLRDVKRTMIVFEYFLAKMDLFEPRMSDRFQPQDSLDRITRSLVLAISICYCARLQKKRIRRDYEHLVASEFQFPLSLPGGTTRFKREIRCCQEVLLDNMELGRNIAKNAALRENIFMMAVCIELKIPLFLVGKPGSSKSLAKAIIAESMRGSSSRSELLRNFKEVHMFSYQCSQLSTPESVIEVFNTARRFQKDQDMKKYVSVVVLDEVGLAEDSPNLPLKALHPLLEDGTEEAGGDKVDKLIADKERVAFIGISNWALDPAKMNRGVMVMRGDPSVQELEHSARGICSDKTDDPVRNKLEPFFRPLAQTYMTVCQAQEFFGLRDFYSLIKMLYWMCDKSGVGPTWPQLEHAIRRNFGGLDADDFDPVKEFMAGIPDREVPFRPNMTNIPKIIQPIVNPDCSELGLIRTSLMTKGTSWHGENRYLLFLTENYAALEILGHYLNDILGISDSTIVERKPEQMEPFILFGSSFPKDKEYTQVCRNINQIKVCMETGRTVILLNLENLYESLYDVLNQYYIEHAGIRYVDLGLQTHRVKCRVHESFKLILIAEKKTVHTKFPTPLINRLEKHFVLTSTVLKPWQLEVLKQLQEWIKQFSNVSGFTEASAFVGYQKDTPAAVIFQATNQLNKRRTEKTVNWEIVDSEILGVTQQDLLQEEEGSDLWRQTVFQLSQFLLLQTASPDALFRLEKTPLVGNRDYFQRIYFEVQHHLCLREFLYYHLTEDGSQLGVLLQVTTHSHLLSREEVQRLAEELRLRKSGVFCYTLQEFDTELDFFAKVSSAFQREPDDTQSHLLIIQCDSGHSNSDLIACARYRIYDQRANSIHKPEGNTHVLFVIHLPQQAIDTSFVGFQGDRWISTHIDDLRPPTKTTLQLHETLERSISEVFCSPQDHETSMLEDVLCLESPGYDVQPHEASETLPEVTLPLEQAPRAIKTSGYYHRLHECIQAAVVKDSDWKMGRTIERVAILVDLIPREPSNTLDESTFHGVLVRHIHRLLEERDQIRKDEKQWALNEALSAKKLKHGGTFRNTLAHKMDQAVISIFAEIIDAIDHNCNLNLMQDENTPHSQFWLAIFKESQIMQFRYEEMVAKGDPHVNRMNPQEEGFKCQLPFFWLIKELFDAQWDSAKATGDVHQQLHTLVSATPLGEVLDGVGSTHCEVFYKCYLNDFVRSVHKCSHKYAEKEYELIADQLNGLVHTIDSNEFLSSRIAAVHVAYHSTKSEILWFGQLASQMPGILDALRKKVPSDSTEMVLHLYALEKALENLDPDPPLNKDETALTRWLNRLRLSQNTITSILSVPSQHELARKAKLQWQLIRAVQMFVEHVVMRYDGVVIYAKRLRLHLKRDSDFLKNITLERVKMHLNTMHTNLKRKPNCSEEYLANIRESCHAFFMEVVSTLCFGSQTSPEPELINTLIGMVFTEEAGTKELSPYKEVKNDDVPVVRSFLLQLLLEHDAKLVKDHLDDYFTKSHEVLGNIDQNLCLLCIQCFEDALFKENTFETFHKRVIATPAILKEGHDALLSHTGQISLQYLEGVAKVRFGLSIVAELLSQRVSDVQSPSAHSVFTCSLLQTARKLCTDRAINQIDDTGSVDTIGPNIFLLKLLVRQYGMDCLQKTEEICGWVVPPQLRNSMEEEHTRADPFVIYNLLGYSNLRTSITRAAYGKQFNDLVEESNDLGPIEAVPLLLALYKKVTLSRASTLPSKALLPDVLNEFDTFITGCKVLSRELQQTARLLIRNKHGDNRLRVEPGQPPFCRILGDVVVHSAIVFFCMQRVNILQPFANMLNNPAALIKTFLPTMPEDIVPMAKSTLKGTFYECPRGHPYLITECGNPTQRYNCPECGAPIGGSGSLAHDNRRSRSEDQTQTGHSLGDPDRCSGTSAPERSLSPAAICVLRAMMHSTLLWASYNNKDATQALCALVQVPLTPEDLFEFFWRHLQRDIKQLATATGRNTEESAIVVHLVLQRILTSQPPQYTVSSSLMTRDDRRYWETTFNQNYIQPVLVGLDHSIGETMDTIMHDHHQEQDQLFYVVYERVKVIEGSLEPHLWTYRSRITLEHLRQTLQNRNIDKHQILYEFLQQEHNLRATQYLPDIVRLQQLFYDNFHHQLDKRCAQRITVKELLNSIENMKVRSEYLVMIESVQKAWQLVGDQLRDHARLRVKEVYLLPAITDETPLEYLIPTTTGAGACTTALVDFLVCTHNNFIERCRNIVTKKEKSEWKRHNVPLTHISRCHLLDYEERLLPIVLSHCHYSLTVGKGQDVVYDLTALEKHILNHFIHGKPHILTYIPRVTFSGTHTAETFAAVRRKVNPQILLPPQVKQELLLELRSVDRLKGALDTIDIVVAFLSSGGGKADKSLGWYIEHTLKMRGQFCEKVQEDLKLGHILSLWQILSVELGRQLTLGGEEPFDLKPEFLNELTTVGEGNQEKALNNCLRSFDLDQLLETLYEFIETYVKHSPPDKSDWTLVDVLDDVLERYGIQVISQFSEKFPTSITLAQTIAAWKHIVHYKEKLLTDYL